MFADSHAHLDMEQFDRDRAEVISRARAAGVEIILSIGTGNPQQSSIERTLGLAENHAFIYAGIGVHPHDARHADESYWAKMEEWADHPKVVVWGEIGLDYYYDLSPREIQRSVFRRQLEIARRRGMPVAIHCRDAWDDLLEILRGEWGRGPSKGILHSFTGSAEHARECLGLGFWISFSGIVTFKNAEPLREAAREIPLDRILIETDSPYLAPVPHRGKRNEPAFVAEVARSLAETKGVSLEEIARHTTSALYELLGVNRPL
jgi:TatD DNase family protein